MIFFTFQSSFPRHMQVLSFLEAYGFAFLLCFSSLSVAFIKWNFMVQLVLIGCWSNCKFSLHIFYYPSPPVTVFWNRDKFAYKLLLNILQTSGSLYGALVGSAVAFSIADVIGWFLFPLFPHPVGISISLSTCKRNWSVWILNFGRKKKGADSGCSLFPRWSHCYYTITNLFRSDNRTSNLWGRSWTGKTGTFSLMFWLSETCLSRGTLCIFRQCMRLQCT